MTADDIRFWLAYILAFAIAMYAFHLSSRIEDQSHRINVLDALLWGNYDEIKRVRAQLENLEIRQRGLVNGKERNASECVPSGRPDIQRSGGDIAARGTDATQRTPGSASLKDKASGRDSKPRTR